jgi:LysM repeat protein
MTARTTERNQVARSMPPRGRRTLTPAVAASALFTVACAALAITFVAARGGLQLPVASSASQVAAASAGPTVALPTRTPAAPTVAPTPIPATPAVPPTAPPTTSPTAAPTPGPTPDALAGLPGCPGIEGCYAYVIRPGDTLSGVASRYVVPVWIVLALNPEITDPSTIVIGDTLYLGRSPFLRLPPCPDAEDCSLYTVRPGDRLSTIAGRYGITTQAILGANPQIIDPSRIYSGQVIRLPHPVEAPPG